MTDAAEMLSCQELVELVTDYLEGALSPEERVLFDEHVESCTDCLNYLEQMRRTIELAGRLTPETLPPGAEVALLGAFRDWNPGAER